MLALAVLKFLDEWFLFAFAQRFHGWTQNKSKAFTARYTAADGCCLCQACTNLAVLYNVFSSSCAYVPNTCEFYDPYLLRSCQAGQTCNVHRVPQAGLHTDTLLSNIYSIMLSGRVAVGLLMLHMRHAIECTISMYQPHPPPPQPAVNREKML
jgi:hypothetical protein